MSEEIQPAEEPVPASEPPAPLPDTAAPTPEPPEPAVEVPVPEPETLQPAPAREVPAPDPAQAAVPAKPMGAGAVIAISLVLAFVVSAFGGLAAGFLGARLATTGTITNGSANTTVKVLPSETSDPAVAAAAAAVPSVVNIDVREATTDDSGVPQGHPSVPQTGNGSGVAFKSAPDGGTYIITNNHVVENADSLTVRDSSGTSYPAKLVGRDPETDIAVVKVEADIPAIELGDSQNLLVGQSVVAIGSPFGLEHSVTSGVVSAIGRSLPDFGTDASAVYPLVDVIQTDAAINPGNSGGALVNIEGKLIGINTAIYSDTGASGGIGFAVPVNTVVRVSEQLIEGGEISHPFIGVIGQTVTPQLVEEEKLTVNEGAYVVEFSEGSGAQSAGMKAGDVIVEVDGENVRSMDDLILQVRRKTVGDTVKITVVREGQRVTLDVAVGNKPAEVSQPSTEPTKTP